jgi:hypothetical protein
VVDSEGFSFLKYLLLVQLWILSSEQAAQVYLAHRGIGVERLRLEVQELSMLR